MSDQLSKQETYISTESNVINMKKNIVKSEIAHKLDEIVQHQDSIKIANEGREERM